MTPRFSNSNIEDIEGYPISILCRRITVSVRPWFLQTENVGFVLGKTKIRQAFIIILSAACAVILPSKSGRRRIRFRVAPARKIPRPGGELAAYESSRSLSHEKKRKKIHRIVINYCDARRRAAARTFLSCTEFLFPRGHTSREYNL